MSIKIASIVFLFQRLAGFDAAVLKECDTSEQNEATQLGASMIPASGLAGFAAAFFVYTATGSLLIAFLAFLASVSVALITDRSILMAVAAAGEMAERKYKRFLLGGCRVLLSLCLSSLTSSAITQYLTKDEIKAELATMSLQEAQQARKSAEHSVAGQADRLLNRKQEIEAELKKLRQTADEKKQAAVSEAEGHAVSGKEGKGPLYEEKRQISEEAKFEYDKAQKSYAPELSDIEAQLKAFRAQAAQAENETERLNKLSQGGLSRQKALMRLVKKDMGALTYYLTIVLVLSLVELLPLIGSGLADLSGYRSLISEAKEKSHERSVRVANARRTRERIAFFYEQAEKLIRSKVAKLVEAATNNAEDTLDEAEKVLVLEVRTLSIAKLSESMKALSVDDIRRQISEAASSTAPTEAQTNQQEDVNPATQSEWLHVAVVDGDSLDESKCFSMCLRSNNPNLILLRDFTHALLNEAQQRLAPENRLSSTLTKDNLLYFNSAHKELQPGPLLSQLQEDRLVCIHTGAISNGGHGNAKR